MLEDPSEEKTYRFPPQQDNKMASKQTRTVVGVVVLCALLLAIALAIGLGVGLSKRDQECPDGPPVPSGWVSQSGSGVYRYAAVTADNDICSTIGTDILARKGGSAVDAAIAALVCLGAVNAQHVGIGGGVMMVINERPRNGTEKEVVTLMGRETAPLSVTRDMFNDNPDSQKTGPMSIAVPGEVRAYSAAWERFGRVAWRDLFQPTIDLCRNGWPVSKSMAASIASALQVIQQDQYLREAYLKSDGTPYVSGDVMKNEKLADVLETIATEGADALYDGSLSQDIVDDVIDAGGRMTLEDLKSNKALWFDPVRATLDNGDFTVLTPPPPGSGVIVEFVLKVMDGYNLTPDDFRSVDKLALFYHRIIEAWRLGIARRAVFVGDYKYPEANTQQWLDAMVSSDYAAQMRQLIKDDDVLENYAPSGGAPDTGIGTGGTSQLNVLTAEGSAVSLCSTVGSLFGSKVRGRKTGIVFNNGVELFSLPTSTNNSANYLAPAKRGRSSTSPIMVLDGNGHVVLLAGGSGSLRIVTATTLVSSMVLWMGQNVSYAVDVPRVHDQSSGTLYYDGNIDPAILAGLRERGHTSQETAQPKYPYLAVVQAIDNRDCVECGPQCGRPCVEAVSDWRKWGKPDGF